MTVRVLQGDCREVLRGLPAASVHCVVTSPPYFGLRSYLPDDHQDKHLEMGSEQTPGEFVAELVGLFRSLRRVLRDDGVCWLNLGDSYSGSRCGPQGATGQMIDRSISGQRTRRREIGNAKARVGNKPKDLLMMPARVAIALQDDGWWIRQDVIWEKPQPMPEAVTDRPTTSHEHVFLLTKAASYFYDREAINDAVSGGAHGRGRGTHPKSQNARDGIKQNSSFSAAVTDLVSARNARSVWRIPPSFFAGAHFATMPIALAERCILAGTSAAGCCSVCGAPWRRVLGEASIVDGRGAGNGFKRVERVTYADARGARGDATPWKPKARATLGWEQTCDCPSHQPIPCTVLDPFGGAGTTGLAAQKIGREAILIELYEKFAAMAQARCAGERYVDPEMQDLPESLPLFAPVSFEPAGGDAG